MTNVFVVMRNSDFTEGRGLMLLHSVFSSGEEAIKYVSQQPGIHGSKQKVERDKYGYYAYANGYQIEEMPVLETVECNKITFLEYTHTTGMVVNAPAIFERKDFIDWLNDPETKMFSWHKKGDQPTEYSDVVVLVNSNYEGDSSDMPEDIWRAICDLIYDEYGTYEIKNGPVHVRLTNLKP